MNNEPNRNPIPEDEMAQRAVSLYGQSNDAMDDFPVLRAFQEYVNAEQDKARKRLVSLSIVFAAIIIVMIAGFMFMLYGINMRNQALSDRLFEYAMRDSRRAAEPVATRPLEPTVETKTRDDAALKAITESLAEMQRKLDSQTNAAKSEAPVQPPVASPYQPSQSELDYQRKMSADAAKLEKLKASLELQKRQLEDERKRLHEIEVDRQRRKLYPELYGEKKQEESPSRRSAATAKPKVTAQRELSDADIQDILREAFPEGNPDDEPRESEKKSPDKITEDDAIEYFKDDEYNLPIGVKGTDQKVNFTLPVE